MKWNEMKRDAYTMLKWSNVKLVIEIHTYILCAWMDECLFLCLF